MMLTALTYGMCISARVHQTAYVHSCDVLVAGAPSPMLYFELS